MFNIELNILSCTCYVCFVLLSVLSLSLFCLLFLFICFCCFWAVYRVTGVCYRIVLGIITKKNILEHLEELKQHTEPLVTSPAPFTHVTPHTHFRTCLLGSGFQRNAWNLVWKSLDSSRLNNMKPSFSSSSFTHCWHSVVRGLVWCGVTCNEVVHLRETPVDRLPPTSSSSPRAVADL